MRNLLLSDGLFEIAFWKDKTAEALAWAAPYMNAGIGSTTEPAMTLAHIIGPDAPFMPRNFTSSLKSGRLALVQAVLRRSDK
jgi:hypothetical protein